MFKIGETWICKDLSGCSLKILKTFQKECKVRFYAPKMSDGLKYVDDIVTKKYIKKLYRIEEK